METQIQTQRKENPLGYEPVGKLLLQFAVPSTISVLVNSVYNIVDQIFIGQGVGYLGNAATTVTFPIITIMMAFATLLGSGGSAYAAIKLGQKKEREAEKTLNNNFMLSIIMGIVLAVIGFIFMEPILRLFGATDSIMPYAKDYASIILIGVPFSVIGPCLSNMARTDGSPRLSMYGILIGAVLNTILDPIYIFKFHWGVKGAAVATITSQIISALILFLYFCKKSQMRLHLKELKLDASICKNVIALGTSSGITQLVACVMQITMNNSLVYYGNMSKVGGDVALSAMGIVMKLAMILASVCIGIGIGSQTIFGFNFGAEKYHRIKHLFKNAVAAATVSVLIGWLVCQLFPGLIVQLFGGGNSAFVSFAEKCLRIYLFGIFCAGFQIVSTNYFQATGQPLKASVLSMLRQLLLLVPLILILPLFFGLNGILFAGPIADMSSAVIVALFVVPEMKKLNRRIKEKDMEITTERKSTSTKQG